MSDQQTDLVQCGVFVLGVEKLLLLVLYISLSLLEMCSGVVELRLQGEDLSRVLRERKEHQEEHNQFLVSVDERRHRQRRLTLVPSTNDATSPLSVSEFAMTLLRSRSSSSTSPSRMPHQSSRNATSTPPFLEDECRPLACSEAEFSRAIRASSTRLPTRLLARCCIGPARRGGSEQAVPMHASERERTEMCLEGGERGSPPPGVSPILASRSFWARSFEKWDRSPSTSSRIRLTVRLDVVASSLASPARAAARSSGPMIASSDSWMPLLTGVPLPPSETLRGTVGGLPTGDPFPTRSAFLGSSGDLGIGAGDGTPPSSLSRFGFLPSVGDGTSIDLARSLRLIDDVEHGESGASSMTGSGGSAGEVTLVVGDVPTARDGRARLHSSLTRRWPDSVDIRRIFVCEEPSPCPSEACGARRPSGEMTAETDGVGARGPRGRFDSTGDRAREKGDGDGPRGADVEGENGRTSGCGVTSAGESRNAAFSSTGVLFRTRSGLVGRKPADFGEMTTGAVGIAEVVVVMVVITAPRTPDRIRSEVSESSRLNEASDRLLYVP